MTNPTTSDLQVSNLSKRFGDFVAVTRLSFNVAHGSFFSILGPSGCGKTTLLRMMAGFISPDEGDIRIGGKSMQGVPPNRRPVNMVFQHLALFPMMNVGENVGYGLSRRGVPKAEIRRRVGQMLERVGLAGAQGKRVDQLSGGQKQRVAIARSLVLEPTLLLLDEPLGALDLKLREHMKIELKQLQAAFGTTFIYITHDQSEALVMSDHVAVMNRGRFEQLGTPQELYYTPRTPFVAGFVGANNRVRGTVRALQDGIATLQGEQGLRMQAQVSGDVSVGALADGFVRPEVAQLAWQVQELQASGLMSFEGVVESILFDGANSAVLLKDAASGAGFRVALPQTGKFAQLKPGEGVFYGYDPRRAVCFAASHERLPDAAARAEADVELESPQAT